MILSVGAYQQSAWRRGQSKPFVQDKGKAREHNCWGQWCAREGDKTTWRCRKSEKKVRCWSQGVSIIYLIEILHNFFAVAVFVRLYKTLWTISTIPKWNWKNMSQGEWKRLLYFTKRSQVWTTNSSFALRKLFSRWDYSNLYSFCV